jgi:hypothetical protein
MSNLTQEQLQRAAVNLPADEFMLGDRIFKVVDLPYDDYTTFMGYIAPVVENICKKIILSRTGVELPGGINVEASSFAAFDLLQVCGKYLPEMAHIVCKQTDPEITVEEVKNLAKKPLPLAHVVLKQIIQNGMISDFKDFFGQMIGLLKNLR